LGRAWRLLFAGSAFHRLLVMLFPRHRYEACGSGPAGQRRADPPDWIGTGDRFFFLIGHLQPAEILGRCSNLSTALMPASSGSAATQRWPVLWCATTCSDRQQFQLDLCGAEHRTICSIGTADRRPAARYGPAFAASRPTRRFVSSRAQIERYGWVPVNSAPSSGHRIESRAWWEPSLHRLRRAQRGRFGRSAPGLSAVDHRPEADLRDIDI